MMAEALRRAAADSGAQSDPLPGADAVRILSMFSRRYRNTARLVAERIGAQPRDEAISPIGGNEPQALVSRACLDIAAGDADTVLICGAEAWRTRSSTPPDELGWTIEDDSVPQARAHRARGRAEPPGRGGPPPLHAHAGLSPVRAGAAPPGGPLGRRPPGARRRAVGRVRRGGGGQPARVDPRRPVGRADPHPRSPQPLGRLAVHEGDERQQRGRAVRRADRVLGRAGDGVGRPPRPLGLPPGRDAGPRHVRRVAPSRPRLVGRGPGGGPRAVRPRRARGRRRGARRPVLVLPVGRADRGRRDRARASTDRSP